MSILQASIYDLKKLPPPDRASYGLRVLTTRSWLRGVGKGDLDYWIPDAGPSKRLLAALRDREVSTQEALIRYEDEQRRQRSCRVVRYIDGERAATQVVAQNALAVLRQLEAVHGTITVLCWEPEPRPCHRHRLRALLLEGTPCALHPEQPRAIWLGSELKCVQCAINELLRRKGQQVAPFSLHREVTHGEEIRMDELRTYMESLRTAANSLHVDYMLTHWLDRGKSAKQMRAAFRQTLEAKQWQAAHGPLEYRAANDAAAKLFAEVIIFLDGMISS